MVSVFFRTILIYGFLLLAMRLMGKRQIGELQISELIVTFMLSELAVNPIANPSMPLLHAIVPILLLLSIEVILSYWMTKSNRMKRLLSGTPAIVICRGKLDQKVMAENRLEVDELLAELRQNGFAGPGEVAYAILEENGKISVFPKAGYGGVTYRELQEGVRDTGIAHPVIVDGEINMEQLILAGKNTHWLQGVLKKRKKDVEKIFLLTVDDSGEIYISEKE
ncbi:MAG: DUF421 domain-containing protein [Clostridia bacterium]|nr:DUF421 domain-containing protein [Clostridia bacterium]